MNADDDRTHKTLDSCKLIDYETFRTVMEYAPSIENGYNRTQIRVCSELIKKITKTVDGNIPNRRNTQTSSRIRKKILDALTVFNQIHGDMDLNDKFVDITTGIDNYRPAVRAYVNDAETATA